MSLMESKLSVDFSFCNEALELSDEMLVLIFSASLFSFEMLCDTRTSKSVFNSFLHDVV